MSPRTFTADDFKDTSIKDTSKPKVFTADDFAEKPDTSLDRFPKSKREGMLSVLGAGVKGTGEAALNLGKGVVDVAKQAFNPLYKTAENTIRGMAGVEENIMKGKAPWSPTSFPSTKNPVTGEIVNAPKTVKQAVGTGLKAAATVIPGAQPVMGAMYGAGGSMEQGGNLGDTAWNATIGAIIGKTFSTAEGKPMISAETKQAVGKAGEVIGKVVKPVGEMAVKAKESMFPKVVSAKDVDKAIDQTIMRVAKPAGVKGNIGQVQKYQSSARDAVKIIYANKDNLGLVDDMGDSVVKLPENRVDFANAIANTKEQIFNQYDALAKQAKDKGAYFNPYNITENLKTVSKNKGYTPQTRLYAKNLIPEIEELRGQDPLVIQQRIKEMNYSLDGYYTGRVEKARAQVDGSVAKAMRTELDDMITKAKLQYGALSTIEKDINRSVISGMKQKGQPHPLYDLFSRGEIAGGILAGDPRLIALGVGREAVLKSVNWMNNPDRMIKSMFDAIEEAAQKGIR